VGLGGRFAKGGIGPGGGAPYSRGIEGILMEPALVRVEGDTGA